jgi:hypothetical protein
MHKFLLKPKSTFLKLEEATGLISSNPHLNKGFVKTDIFTTEKLKELGFDFDDLDLVSKHTEKESLEILSDISRKVATKVIDTRKMRGQVLEVLEKENRQIINKNSKNIFQKISVVQPVIPQVTISVKKQTPRTKKKAPEFFDGLLYLVKGPVSDLYRDISDLYQHYIKYQNDFSQYFPSLLRMSLRLLVEGAASDVNLPSGKYIQKYFTDAKANLSPDSKTTLYSKNVKEETLLNLLHIGAHNYTAANDLEQTIAMSIIIGKILEISHGR